MGIRGLMTLRICHLAYHFKSPDRVREHRWIIFPNSYSQADNTGICNSVTGRKGNLSVCGKKWQVSATVTYEAGRQVGCGNKELDRGWGVMLEQWVLRCEGATCMASWRLLSVQCVPKRKKSFSMISSLIAAPWGPQYNSLLSMWKQGLARKHG